MSEVRQQILIEASPRAVWELITDVDRHPEWCTFVDAAAGMNPCGQYGHSKIVS
jgi:uncharacterized protein YndB with AHSA1/START domain